MKMQTKNKSLLNPLTLPCGVVVKNRFCKSAMSENMADKGGRPSKELFELYRRWGKGNVGILISGNVMVDAMALGERHNVVLENEDFIEEFRYWAEVTQVDGTQLWMQLNHPGRQVPKNLNKEAVSPSDIPLKQKALFGQPRALNTEEIWDIIKRFANSARIAKKAGWAGVQIHGAHGYLVSQFLSPHTNRREDEWGGDLAGRSKFVIEIYRAMRQEVGDDYPIGIKLNSADFQRGGFTEDESLEVIKMLSKEGIDLIEISGGTYEKAAMMGVASKASTVAREAYFADFIVKARAVTDTPLMLTGGFRTFSVMAEAIDNNELDMIGLARPLAVFPEIISDFCDGKAHQIVLTPPRVGIKSIDQMGFLDTLWHSAQLQRMGRGLDPDARLSSWKIVYKTVKEMVFA